MKRMDEGHKETDELLEKLERRISQEYSQAAKEMQEKARAYFDKFDEQDKEMRARLDAEKITKKSYQAWRRENMLMDKQYKAMRDVLAQDCTNANKIAMNMVYDNMKDVYAINANYGAFQVENGSQMNTSFTLYDRKTVERLIRDDPDLLPKPRISIPEDLRWNRNKINSALLQGILQGDSIPQIAARLKSVTGMLERAAVRNARTMTTGAECKGRIDSYKRAEAMGIKMKKMWVATLDGRTRHEHRILDGQQVEVNKPFEVDGYKLDCPGDPAGDPEMVYNCRCTVIAVIPDTKVSEEGIGILERDGKYKGMTYEEWKRSKPKPQSKNKKKGKKSANKHKSV